MTRYSATAFLVAALGFSSLALATPARADDKTELLHDANLTVNDLKSDPAFATAARMMRGARAVYIVPHLVKGGFIFGAEGGSGVLLRRAANGGWGTPRFYDLASASFGFQAGLQTAKLVFIINSERALSGIEAGNFKIGGQAGITVANLSSGAEGATTARGGDIVVWTSGTGLFGGLAFNGSAITPDRKKNAVPATGREAQALRANLASVR
jgi:lipid-binding SYLF domain-containing protein